MSIRKVVIPVAGWGTRSLPASKNIPKEMLPIFNKPVIQYVVEEALQAAIKDVVLVTSREKSVIEDYFDYNPQLEQVLERAGKHELLQHVRHVAEMVNVTAVRQKMQLGLGHAVLCAKHAVGHEPFAVMLGDDFVHGQGVGLSQLVQVAEQTGKAVIGVMEVPSDQVNRYGIAVGLQQAGGIFDVQHLVEKPKPGSVDSNLAIVGRYVLPPTIFQYLENVAPGHGGEIQLTDALAAFAKDHGMLAVRLDGMRVDAGNWVDYLAANIFFALQDPSLHHELKAKIRALVCADNDG